jgi:hypothetical protein
VAGRGACSVGREDWREEVLQLSGLKGLGMKELWSVPIFLWVGLTCFAFIPLWRAFSGEHYKLEQRLERHPQRAGWGGWSFVEQLAVIMGIISFIIQVAQWVYLWL